MIQRLQPKAIEILTARIANEQKAFYFYISASAWCRLNGFENAAKYFLVESHGEEYHFKKILSFLADWNVQINLPDTKDPIEKFVGLPEILRRGYDLEYKLYKDYETNAIEIFAICQATYSFLQEFVRVQNDSVIQASKNIIKLENYLQTDPGLMLFDKEVFGEFSCLYY